MPVRPAPLAATAPPVALAAASVLIGAAPRIALAAGALPSFLRPFTWSDVYATYVQYLSGGRIPYVDTFFDYPPGIGYVAGLFAGISKGAVAYVALWAVLAALAAGGVAFLIARETTPMRAIAFWSLSPQLLLYGGANFDVLAVLALVGGIILARRGRPVSSLVVLGIGTVVKIFPAVAVPLEVMRLRRTSASGAALAAAAFALTVVVLGAPSVLAAHPSTEGLALQSTRTNFDSVWGLVLATLTSLGLPGEAAVLWLSLAGLVLTYGAVLWRAGPRSDPARLSLFGLLSLLLWSRLFSPQYSLWALPFFALIPMSPRPFAVLAVADIVVFATVYPLTLLAWAPSDPGASILFGFLVGGVALRHTALIWMWRAAGRA